MPMNGLIPIFATTFTDICTDPNELLKPDDESLYKIKLKVYETNVNSVNDRQTKTKIKNLLHDDVEFKKLNDHQKEEAINSILNKISSSDDFADKDKSFFKEKLKEYLNETKDHYLTFPADMNGYSPILCGTEPEAQNFKSIKTTLDSHTIHRSHSATKTGHSDFGIQSLLENKQATGLRSIQKTVEDKKTPRYAS